MTRQSILLLMFAALTGTGCTGLLSYPDSRHGRSSSLVDYLYPGGEIPPEYEEAIPHLKLPLRVGIGFLPDESGRGPTEAQREEVLGRVRASFEGRDFIQHIDTIPSHYLRSMNGVAGLTQLGRLLGVDAVALVAYDQVATSNERDSALLYWTIVGAYIVKGNAHEVQTFMDTAVVDVRTAKLIIRAPGVVTESANSTLSDNKRGLDQRQSRGFEAATTDMIGNLDNELSGLRERVRAGGDRRMKVSWREGFGGGTFGPVSLVLASLLVLGRRRTRI